MAKFHLSNIYTISLIYKFIFILLLGKKSKRQPARLRYKIEKKIRDHNRKVRKEAKKNPINKKKNVIQVPNVCPFKENILKEVEAMKKQKEEEKKQQREIAKKEKQKKLEDQKKQKLQVDLERLVSFHF